MTTEQREAIDRLNKDKNKPLACGDITIVNISDLDTALSLIKEQRKENELAKEQLKKQCEIADERNDLLVKVQELQKENKEKDEEISNLKIENNNAWEDWNNLEQASYEEELRLKEKIKEKDKTIDLMAEQLAGLTIWNNEKEEPVILYDKEEVKKYYERESKKMKKKKEIEIPKNKYIYQRYNGTITKYIVDNEYYIAVGTGIATKKDETVLLGKVAENIIDLIEVGDIVHIKDVLHQDIVHIWSEDYLKALKEDLKNGIKLVEILTHEQFEQNCFKI